MDESQLFVFDDFMLDPRQRLLLRGRLIRIPQRAQLRPAKTQLALLDICRIFADNQGRPSLCARTTDDLSGAGA